MNTKKTLRLLIILHALATCPMVICPKINFRYDWKSRAIDLVGSLLWVNITAEKRQQLNEQLPHLVHAWEEAGPILFGQVYEQFKRGFTCTERTASCYLSNNWSYGSNRFLVIGLRYKIDVATWQAKISMQEGFTCTVFHELLHIWVDENIDIEKSEIIKKYIAENKDVREHIHLMAIQKMVYTKLNQPEMLDYLDTSYRTCCPPAYRRAWEIVNDIEGCEAIIQDALNNLRI